MSTVEALAVGAVGASLAFAYAGCRWQQRRRVLQWFYAKHSDDLTALSELVREQLSQKAFALQRAIELERATEIGVMDSPEAAVQPIEHCLSLSAAFSYDLERVSDELSMPFVEDSLPLALQHLAKRWADETADTELRLELPSDWPCQNTEQHRLVLWCIRECLRALQPCLSQATAQQLKIVLVQSQGVAKLQLAFNGQESQRAKDSLMMSDAIGDMTRNMTRELGYIQQIFRMLMPAGRCKLTGKSSELVGKFRWALTSTGRERSH